MAYLLSSEWMWADLIDWNATTRLLAFGIPLRPHYRYYSYLLWNSFMGAEGLSAHF